MTLKEKLELLWKYLLLAVIVFGLVQIGNNRKSRMWSHDFSGHPGSKMMWFGDEDHDFGDMDVDVEIEKLIDGDSTITVIINGETMTLDDMKKLEKPDRNVYIKKMRHHRGDKDRKVKIIKKKMIDKD